MPDLKTNFLAAKQLIDGAHQILLTMHERMDGDDGGSVLALAHHLESANKQVICAIKQGVPPPLSFLPGSEKIVEDIEQTNFDLIVTCGCSSLARCGNEKILAFQAPIINIDHHPDNSFFGQVNLVDAGKSSVAELVYDLFVFLKWPINRDIATCLLTGIVTDTGSFRHSNTTASSLQAAAMLMKKGGQINKIIKHTFKNKNTQTLKAWGRALENSYYDEKNKIIYSVITQKDLEEIGQPPQAAFEGLTETLNTVPEAKFALFIRQEGDIIKGSLRSEKYKNIDVASIAKLFGGGGHKQAAGFSVAGKLMKDKTGKWKVV